MACRIEFLRDEQAVARRDGPQLVTREGSADIASAMFGAMKTKYGATEYRVVEGTGHLREGVPV